MAIPTVGLTVQAVNHFRRHIGLIRHEFVSIHAHRHQWRIQNFVAGGQNHERWGLKICLCIFVQDFYLVIRRI